MTTSTPDSLQAGTCVHCGEMLKNLEQTICCINPHPKPITIREWASEWAHQLECPLCILWIYFQAVAKQAKLEIQ